jgi:hypothetical protein
VEGDAVGRGEAQVPEAPVPSHEGGHEVVCRGTEDFLWGGVLGKLPAHREDGHLVAQDGGFIDIVGDEDDGLGQVLLEPQQLLLQLVADHGIHGAERLIHEQNGRISGERAGHPHTLLLAAGELGRVTIGERPGQAHHIQEFLCAAAGIRLGHAVQTGHGGNVVQHGAVGQEPRRLHHVAHGAAEFGSGHGGDILAVNRDGPGGWFHHPVDHAQRGCLAAA